MGLCDARHYTASTFDRCMDLHKKTRLEAGRPGCNPSNVRENGNDMQRPHCWDCIPAYRAISLARAQLGRHVLRSGIGRLGTVGRIPGSTVLGVSRCGYTPFKSIRFVRRGEDVNRVVDLYVVRRNSNSCHEVTLQNCISNRGNLSMKREFGALEIAGWIPYIFRWE